MQTLHVSDNPYNGKLVRCGQCSACSSARSGYYGPYNPDKPAGNSPGGINCERPFHVQIYPYKNNMILINANFEHVVKLNKDLQAQVTSLNTEIAELKRIVVQNDAKITQNTTTIEQTKIHVREYTQECQAIRTEMKDFTVKLASTEEKITELMRKVGILIGFVPQFVRETSKWFVKLLVGIKTNSLEGLEIAYDTDMIAVI